MWIITNKKSKLTNSPISHKPLVYTVASQLCLSARLESIRELHREPFLSFLPSVCLWNQQRLLCVMVNDTEGAVHSRQCHICVRMQKGEILAYCHLTVPACQL